MSLKALGWLYLWIGGVSIFGYIIYRFSEEAPDAEAPKTKPKPTWSERGAAAFGCLDLALFPIFLFGLFLPHGLYLFYAWPLIFIVPWWLKKRRQNAAPTSVNPPGQTPALDTVKHPEDASPRKPEPPAPSVV